MSKKYCVLFNPFSEKNQGEKRSKQLNEKISISEYIDITSIESYADFFNDHLEENILICGGDGTLNRFINAISDIEINNEIFFFPCGSGNDFARDVDPSKFENGIIPLNKYIKDLPSCTVNGKEYKFINGVGYGIDGYCCEVGDKLRATSTKEINYTNIAIKGLLFDYTPTDAKVTVDGEVKEFKKVWIAPTMNGRFYGGGMIPTPNQNRLSEEKELSVMIFHGTGKISTLMIFPSIFKGEHIKKEKNVTILTGKEITVEFSAPRPLQIDGETILGVEKYTAKASKILAKI